MSLKNYSAIGSAVIVRFRDLGYAGTVKDASGNFSRPLYLVELDEAPLFRDHVSSAGIEDGESLRRQMTQDGCLDGDRVTCMWVYWEDLELIAAEGLYAEYMEPDPVPQETCQGAKTVLKTWPGRVLFHEGALALELLDPVPASASPLGVDRGRDLGQFIAEGSDLLAAIPLDASTFSEKHGLRVMRPETADYYASFE